jgi:long-subunit acyl-CoA synthetase (AMP-forming)
MEMFALQALKVAGVKVMSWEEAIEAGKAAPVAARKPVAEDVCTIMYTSGTTGDCI